MFRSSRDGFQPHRSTSSLALSCAQAEGAVGPQLIGQENHGFSAGNYVRYDGATYIKAQADTEAHAVIDGVVISARSAHSFILGRAGSRVPRLSGLTPGATYYLSADTAGEHMEEDPGETGKISKPVFRADSETSGVFIDGPIAAPILGGKLQLVESYE